MHNQIMEKRENETKKLSNLNYYDTEIWQSKTGL